MFKKFIELYKVTLPYAFDTNLYSSPLHLMKGPQCEKEKFDINDKLKDYYVIMTRRNQSWQGKVQILHLFLLQIRLSMLN